MTDTFTAQCPHCQTSFSLKRSQLTVARGSVRCGACLQVFNAASQIANTDAAESRLHITTQVAAAANPASHPAPASKQPLMIHDDMDLDDLDDLDLDEELARLEQEEQLRAQELSDEFASVQARLDPSPAPQEDTLKAPQSMDDDWSDELLNTEPVAPLYKAPEQTDATPLEPSAAVMSAQEPQKYSSAHRHAPLSALALEPSHDPLPYFADEPLRLDWRPKKTPWKRWFAWGLLNIAALLLLLGQYTFHNFTQLARQDSTRPWLEVICPLIDCQLPAKVDVQQIKSSNLLVRSHPEFPGALLVDAIIYNRASFSQPFPLLELSFTDASGHTLARRRFTPQEYLAGELAGQAQMPQQTPIHIALEILEPNGGATNYRLDFVSPE